MTSNAAASIGPPSAPDGWHASPARALHSTPPFALDDEAAWLALAEQIRRDGMDAVPLAQWQLALAQMREEYRGATVGTYVPIFVRRRLHERFGSAARSGPSSPPEPDRLGRGPAGPQANTEE